MHYWISAIATGAGAICALIYLVCEEQHEPEQVFVAFVSGGAATYLLVMTVALWYNTQILVDTMSNDLVLPTAAFGQTAYINLLPTIRSVKGHRERRAKRRGTE